jgi:hypothetical protein
MNGICVRLPKIPERDRHCERAIARLSSVVSDTGRMALPRSIQAIEATRSLARPVRVCLYRAMRQKREILSPRTKPFGSSQGHQISQGRSGQPFDEKSENGATKYPSIGELGAVEYVGPLPQLENQESDRGQTGVKTKP